MNQRKSYTYQSQKANYSEIYDQQEYLNAIIENSYDGIFITDHNAIPLKLNSAYEHISGLNRNDVLGISMSELVKNGSISRSGTLLALERKESVTLEQEFKTGKKAMITSTPIFDEKGNIVLVVTNVRDVTELYELKEQLDQNKRLTQRMNSELEELRSHFMNAEDMVMVDKKMLRAVQIAQKVAKMDVTVLLLGETGVGKEKIAAFIYQNSNRKNEKMIKVNCGAIPPALIESELFGYERGAFTGANREGKIGLFELADKGTIFLDEVAELPLDSQVKLLRVLQEQEIERVGGTKTIKIDVRVISATNCNLRKLVKKRLFREDLYYRLNVLPIVIPPLRERKEDIFPLIHLFLKEFNTKYNTDYKLDPKSLQWAVNYSWPGNVRELRNLVERAIVLSTNQMVMLDENMVLSEMDEMPPEKVNLAEDGVIDLKKIISDIEFEYIDQAYQTCGNVRDAAAKLNMDPSTFVRKRKKHTLL